MGHFNDPEEHPLLHSSADEDQMGHFDDPKEHPLLHFSSDEDQMGPFDDPKEHPLLHSSADKDQLEWIGSSTGATAEHRPYRGPLATGPIENTPTLGTIANKAVIVVGENIQSPHVKRSSG